MTSDTALPLRGVMIFARDPQTSCRWYARHVLRVEPEVIQAEAGLWFVEIAGIDVSFHPADDERNPVGANVVPYFTTTSVTSHREHLLTAGASPLRGPLAIGKSRTICQLTDPLGGVFGLDGPA